MPKTARDHMDDVFKEIEALQEIVGEPRNDFFDQCRNIGQARINQAGLIVKRLFNSYKAAKEASVAEAAAQLDPK